MPSGLVVTETGGPWDYLVATAHASSGEEGLGFCSSEITHELPLAPGVP